jgi:pimeloyl-ACP methyl ester carboxylesterase
MAEEIAAGIPGAELAIVEECGHLSTMERPEEVAVLMRRWLEA